MSENLVKTLDITSRWITPAGIIIILLLQSQFVSRVEFEAASEKLSGRVEKIEQLLIRMEANAETDKRHSAQLDDHEGRLRAIEKNGGLR
jgi:hypothetical protein